MKLLKRRITFMVIALETKKEIELRHLSKHSIQRNPDPKAIFLISTIKYIIYFSKTMKIQIFHSLHCSKYLIRIGFEVKSNSMGDIPKHSYIEKTLYLLCNIVQLIKVIYFCSLLNLKHFI